MLKYLVTGLFMTVLLVGCGSTKASPATSTATTAPRSLVATSAPATSTTAGPTATTVPAAAATTAPAATATLPPPPAPTSTTAPPPPAPTATTAPPPPAAPTATKVPAPPTSQYLPGDAYNCSDFKTYQEAKAYLDAVPGDPSKLDTDHDGIPCESLPGHP